MAAGPAGSWLVKGAEECARFARPITRLPQGRADPARRLQWRRLDRSVAGEAARRLDRSQMEGFASEQHLSGHGARESLVRSEAEVVEQERLEPGFESSGRERAMKAVEACGLLERQPETLEPRCGLDAVGTGEALGHPELRGRPAEDVGGELTPEVAHQIPRMREATRGSAEQAGRVLRGGSELEDLDREGRSREGIEDGCDVERGTEELFDLAEIHHPDVVDEPGADRPGLRRGGGRAIGRRGHETFPSVAADRACGNSPPGSREQAGTEVLASESESCEELRGGSNDVGRAADGGRGLDDRARGS